MTNFREYGKKLWDFCSNDFLGSSITLLNKNKLELNCEIIKIDYENKDIIVLLNNNCLEYILNFELSSNKKENIEKFEDIFGDYTETVLIKSNIPEFENILSVYYVCQKNNIPVGIFDGSYIKDTHGLY